MELVILFIPPNVCFPDIIYVFINLIFYFLFMFYFNDAFNSSGCIASSDRLTAE
jgi:hypothetical protein